ncbi:MAG TPA: TraR/DksA family transcriptional regulator [Phycisphaerales bacterium]|nr:TraR/DksA family transcriptional regulator [Phycisphaerales bacterium]
MAAKSAPKADGGKGAKPAGKAGAATPDAKGGDAKGGDAKNGRKGITIVQPKPVKKTKPKPKAPMSGAHAIPSMLSSRPGSHKPLIPSGPAASPSAPIGFHGHTADGPKGDVKSPFGKKELAHFRQILLQKRAELVGDVSSMESEALKGESGSLSSVPQHMAEQGSENYDQSLSLDLAAADRKLIREIDDALARIDNGTYGICELTGKPIRLERLEELPWARYSIEAARDLERRHMRL